MKLFDVLQLGFPKFNRSNWPTGFRQHDDLYESIEEQGLLSQIIVNQSTRNVLCGVLRCNLLLTMYIECKLDKDYEVSIKFVQEDHEEEYRRLQQHILA